MYSEILRELLQAGADPELPNDIGRTAMHLAANLGNVEVIRLLLEHGANIDTPDEDGATALWLAAAGGSVHALEHLLSAGADPARARRADGDLLYAAKMSKNKAVIARVKTLLRAK